MLIKVDEDFCQKLIHVARCLLMARKAIVDNKKRLGLYRGAHILITIDGAFETLVQAMGDLDPNYFEKRLVELLQDHNMLAQSPES